MRVPSPAEGPDAGDEDQASRGTPSCHQQPVTVIDSNPEPDANARFEPASKRTAQARNAQVEGAHGIYRDDLG